MEKVLNPKNEIVEIELNQLLLKALEMKKAGLRFSQACAAWINDRYELSYSWVNNETFDLTTLRVYAGLETIVPSITELIPTAVFYENEMAEMYDVKIDMMNLDFKHRLYRLKEGLDAPLLPEDVREKSEALKAGQREAAKEAEEKEEK